MEMCVWEEYYKQHIMLIFEINHHIQTAWDHSKLRNLRPKLFPRRGNVICMWYVVSLIPLSVMEEYALSNWQY
jgi:hypothetical protein